MRPREPLLLGLSNTHPFGDGQAWTSRFARALEECLGLRVEARLYPEYRALYGALLAGRIDIAWMAPLLHLRAAREGAQVAVIPERGGWYSCRSAVLVSKSSQWGEAAQLNNVRAAWRERTSATGYLFPKIDLQRICGRHVFASERFFGTPQEAAQAVVRDDADLCASFVTENAAHDPAAAMLELIHSLGAPIANSLRILHVTESIPPDALVLRPEIDEQGAAQLVEAFSRLGSIPDGKWVLTNVLQADKLVPVNKLILSSLTVWADAAEAESEGDA